MNNDGLAREYLSKAVHNIECETLRQNCIDLFDKVIFPLGGYELFKSGQLNELGQKIDESVLDGLTLLGLYQQSKPTLRQKFGIPVELVEDVVECLEAHAVGYVSHRQSDVMRGPIKSIHETIVSFVDDLSSLSSLISDDQSDFTAFLSMASGDKDASIAYSNALSSIKQAERVLRGMPEFLLNSGFAKSLEIGKRSPRGNPALQYWVERVYSLWVQHLERKIDNSNDGFNGRIHLLDLLEFALRPLHPAVEFNTIDNMLRKVQRDVKNRGGFSHPKFSLGASSPFRAIERNWES